MFKSFFMTRDVEETVDREFERTMLNIHSRMERMLEAEQLKRQRFSTIENTPSYYR